MEWIVLLAIPCALFIKFYLNRMSYRRTLKRRKRRGKYIYFYINPVAILPQVKIGRTKNSKQRLTNQKTPLPYGMFVVGALLVKDEVYAENVIHKKFALQRVHDDKRNEWFWITPSVLWYILAVRDMKITRKVRHEVSN